MIPRDGVTVFEGVPTMFAALVRHLDLPAADTSAMRCGVSGGAALPVQVLEEFEAVFGAPVLDGYGLSETSPVASFNHPDRPRKPGSIGEPTIGNGNAAVISTKAANTHFCALFLTARVSVQPVKTAVTARAWQKSPRGSPPSWPTGSISTNPG